MSVSPMKINYRGHTFTCMVDCALPYPLMSSVSVMPFMEALKVTMLVADGPSVFSWTTVSLTTDSLPGPDTSTLPRYTSSHAVCVEGWEVHHLNL